MPQITELNIAKAASMSVFADVGWQYFNQEVDIHFTEKHMIGTLSPDLFTNLFIYPFVLAGLAYAGARYYSKHCREQDEQEAQKKDDQYIAASIVIGIAGWMSGFLPAFFLMGEETNGLILGAYAGLGTMALSMAYNIYYDGWSEVKANPGTYTLLAASLFMGGFMWYVGYLTPEWIGAEEGSSLDKLARGFISPLVTGMGTVVTMAPMWVMRWSKEDSADLDKKKAVTMDPLPNEGIKDDDDDKRSDIDDDDEDYDPPVFDDDDISKRVKAHDLLTQLCSSTIPRPSPSML